VQSYLSVAWTRRHGRTYDTSCKVLSNTNPQGLILPVVLCGCETWSLTMREEHKLRVFENRLLRRIFGPKRDEVAGEWRKLHNEELSYQYFS